MKGSKVKVATARTKKAGNLTAPASGATSKRGGKKYDKNHMRAEIVI